MTKQKKKQNLKPDTKFKQFWRNNERFADLFNGTIFQGKQVLSPEHLSEQDTDLSTIIGMSHDIQGIQRSRDIMKISDLGSNFLLLGVENQSFTHYGMPLRTLTYDVLGYIKQCEEITAQRKRNHELLTTEEFLSGLKATDLLQPIITLVLYYGEEPWNGPLTIKDMLVDVPPEIKNLIVDYKIILVQIQDAESYSFQNEDVATVFRVAKELFSGNINRLKTEYTETVLSTEVLEMIGTITGSKDIINIVEKKGDMEMCKALDEYWNKAKEECRNETLEMIGTITDSKDMITIIEKNEDMEMCKALGEYWNKAKEEGLKMERNNIVIRMLESNLPEETICLLTAITLEEINLIKHNLCI